MMARTEDQKTKDEPYQPSKSCSMPHADQPEGKSSLKFGTMCSKSHADQSKWPLLWCTHDGKHTLARDCPYTLKFGITCSMSHADQRTSRNNASSSLQWLTKLINLTLTMSLRHPRVR